MPQSKSQKEKESPSGEELVNRGQTQPIVETIEEADPKKKSTYPVQWEYHVMRVQDTAMRLPADDLDALGDQGWEMIAIFHLHATINFVFKRFALPASLALSEAKQLKRLEELEKK